MSGSRACPCGSGRKYKACHQIGGWVEFEHRAAWLYDKMVRFVLGHAEAERRALARAFAGDGRWMAELRWLSSPITADLALWEGKLADGFAASRRSLLPADEAALLEPWQATRRSVFEIGKLVDRRLTLHDLVRGGSVVVDNVHPDRQLARGQAVVARPTPVGEQWRCFCPMIPLGSDAIDPVSRAVEMGDAMLVAAAIGSHLDPR